jgi:hypothetical protein
MFRQSFERTLKWLRANRGLFIVGALFTVWLSLIVFHVITPKENIQQCTYSNTDQRKEECKSIAPPVSAEDRLAEYTFWLTMFTAALVGVSAWQGYLILRAEGGTKAALKIGANQAKATELMARNMLRVQKPFLNLVDLRLDTMEGSVSGPVVYEDGERVLVSLKGNLENVGSGIAIIRAARFDWNYDLKIGPMPPVTGDRFYGDEMVHPGKKYKPWLPICTPALPLDFGKGGAVTFLGLGKNLYLCGWVRYADLHGVIRRRGVAFEYMPPIDPSNLPFGGTFYACGPDAYWYEIEEESEADA